MLLFIGISYTILFLEFFKTVMEFVLIVRCVKIRNREQHVSCKETTVTRALFSCSNMPSSNLPRSVEKVKATINEVCIGRPHILLVAMHRIVLNFETKSHKAIREDLDESSLIVREPLFVLVKNIFREHIDSDFQLVVLIDVDVSNVCYHFVWF